MTIKNKTQNIDKELVVMTTAGSVDDGKSTLIGRLLYDCNDLYEDQIAAIKKRNKSEEIRGEDLALITDGLSAEREQGITIDVAYRHFSRPKREFIIADVPGHEQYTRNMVTGASKASLALIIVDARKGMLLQSKRHLFIANLLGISHILVVVNKMDLAGYKRGVYEKIMEDFISYAQKMNVKDLQFIPISALAGDMVVHRGNNMDWYNGPTLLSYLENVQIVADRNLIDFRFPVQYIVQSKRESRGYSGTIAGGIIKPGDPVMILPSGQKSKIKSIILGKRKLDYAFCPQSVVLTLEDEIDISRGDMIIREKNSPDIGNNFTSMICWFSDKPSDMKHSYLLKHTTKTSRCFIRDFHYVLNIDNLHRENGNNLKLNDIGRVNIEITDPLFFDAYRDNKNTGSFILIDELSDQTVGAGMILRKGVKNISKSDIKNYIASIKNGFVLWFTGLSAAGKTTIADALFEHLNKNGIHLERLDGDVARENLTKDLGFSKEDRDENIRRIGFVAGLLSKNNVGVIASFISPYKKQRQELRKKVYNFIEVFVDTPLEICEKRDPKGMYKKARAGEIKQFTGISDPYEAPEKPDIHLKSGEWDVERCVEEIIKYLREKGYIE